MKKPAALAALVLLGGCGFHPMYSAALAPELSSIYVEPIAERDGYELRNELIDLLHSDGQTAGKRYRLTVRLNESAQGVALQNDATITRYNNTLSGSYVLSDMQGHELTKGDQKELASYNVADSPYATQVEALDSSKRAAQDMAERIHLDLGAWFRRKK